MNQKRVYKIFLFIILVLTMYNNLDHSAHVYHDVAMPTSDQGAYGWLQAYLVVIVIDLSVIAFIIAGRHKESAIFAWILFFINLIFFDVLKAVYQSYIAQNPEEKIELFRRILAKVFFSGIFSYFIHRFSVLFYEHRNEASFVLQLENVREDLKKRDREISELQQTITSQAEQLENNEQRFTVLKKDVSAWQEKARESQEQAEQAVAELDATKARLSRKKTPIITDETISN